MDFRQQLRAACRYWERRRLVYNLVLGAVTVVISYEELTALSGEPVRLILRTMIVLMVFCILANLCYSVAYVPDLVLGRSPLRKFLAPLRTVLFFSGTTLASACLVAVYFVPH